MANIKIDRTTIKLESKKKSLVEIISRVVVVIIWLATFTIALGWLLNWRLPFKPEPVTAVLGLLSAGVTGLVSGYLRLLKRKEEELHKERFSMPDALAYGYVENFLEPAITKLVSETKPGATTPRIYIYMPEEMSELEPKAIDRTLARIREHDYSTSVVNLEIEAGRTRDLLTILKEKEGKFSYFDFPNTLRTLAALVEYKVPSKAESFNKEKKRELGKVYIQRFKQKVGEMIREKGLEDYVIFTDKNLEFLW